MKNTMLIGFIIAVIVIGSGAFYGGMVYGKSKAGCSDNPAGERARLGQGQQTRGGRNASGGFVNGDIIAKDDKSLTIKLRDGGSKIIFLSGSTQIMKSVNGFIGDLSVGQNVMVNGGTNADGSITAQAIQLRQATSTPRR